MIIKANNNIPALSLLYAPEKNKGTEGIFKKLSTGQIATLFQIDDPAAIDGTMKVKMRELDLNARYAQEAVTVAKIAQEGLENIQSGLERMQELVAMASEDVLTDEDRQKIQEEIGRINKKIDDTVDKTQYKGHKILADEPETGETDEPGTAAAEDDIVKDILGEFAKEFGQEGFTSKALGTDKVDVSSVEAARDSMKIVEQAIKNVKNALKNWKTFEEKHSRYFELDTPEDSTSLRNKPFMIASAVELVKYSLLKADANLLLANSGQDPDRVTSLLK